ncbi:MAG TPA: hypothetical protein VFF94_08720, partial [Novosphingobium sp.]|nr:hypothetical protein [Novosphingobium sp.]
MTRKVAAALGALCLMAGAALPATPASAQTKAEIDTARDTIWTLEQSIYAGRAKGDLRSYANNLAKNYLSWPP